MTPKWALIFLSLQILLFESQAYSHGCFTHCVCNDVNTINCTNVGDNGLRILSQLAPDHDLNYLIINGARLGELPNKNLFNGNVYPNLHTIKFINAGITSFGPLTFSGAPQLSYLNLDGNPLREVEPKALDGLKSLQSLSLNNIFDAERENNEKVLENIFESELPHLQNVSLRKNELRFDLNNLVCNLPSLTLLDLSNNRLEAFSLPSNCASPIETLFLHDNEITDLPSFPDTPIKELTLYDNPLDCDWNPCEYMGFLDLVKNKNKTLCASPKNLKLHTLDEMIEDSDCKPFSVIPTILLCLILLVIVALGLLWWRGGRRTLEFYKESDYDMVQLADENTNPTYV